MIEASARTLVCEISRRLWERGLVGAAEGNVTVRISPDTILVTPSGSSLGHLSPEELVVMDLDGQVKSHGKPSSEVKLHLHIYRRRPDCMAVIHAHPLTATALTLVGEAIPDNVMPEAAYVLGPVATVPWAMPTTDEVPRAIDPFLDDHKTFLLSHHGAVVMGKDLVDAYNRMETLERIATMVRTAHEFGAMVPMPKDAFAVISNDALHGRL